MGAMKAPEKKEIPTEIAYLFEFYKQLKFERIANKSHNPDDENSPAFKLLPRPMVTYSEINSFNQLSCMDLQPWEVDIIMGIDGIFESSRSS